MAAENPDALARLHVDPLEGYQPHQARRLVYGAGIDDPDEQAQVLGIVEKLYRCFVESERDALRDQPADRDARRRGARTRCEGDDRRLGALPPSRPRGDARRRGGRPARGASRARRASPTSSSTARSGSSGTAPGSRWRPSTSSSSRAASPRTSATSAAAGDAQGVVDALEVITRDAQVRSIFFNIFGGITRCDEVARGILTALEQIEIALPIVVRLDGTNAEEGRRMLADAAPANLHVEPTMLEAAQPRGGAGGMTDVWSQRADAFRDEPDAQRGRRPRPRGRVVRARPRRRRSTSRPAAGTSARRLREAGLAGRDLRPVPRGWSPTSSASRRTCRSRTGASTSSRARESRRTTSRTSRKAVAELARVARSGRRVEDDVPRTRRCEEAERLRDPSHVRNYREDEWRAFFDRRRARGRRGASGSSTRSRVDEWLAARRRAGRDRRTRARAARRPDPRRSPRRSSRSSVSARVAQR